MITLKIILIALAVAAVSLTLTKSHIAAPFQDWLRARSLMLWKLSTCAYCVSHWVAVVAVAFAAPTVFDDAITNFVVLTFAVISLSSMIVGVVMRALFMHEREVSLLRDEVHDLNTHINILKGAHDE